MGASPLRYKRLIKELPKHKYAQDALLASGFSESVARTQSKRVLQSAIKYQAKEILAQDLPKGKGKELMNELVGLSREELFIALKKIALQDKDYSSALKVLSPLVKEHGVVLSAEDDSKHVSVPILNVIVGDKTGDKPVIEQVEQSTSIEDGSTKP